MFSDKDIIEDDIRDLQKSIELLDDQLKNVSTKKTND